MRIHRRSTLAFTLVEVSLVLAVLGLLVGTVVGGRQLLKNQALNKLMSDGNLYMIAMQRFKVQRG